MTSYNIQYFLIFVRRVFEAWRVIKAKNTSKAPNAPQPHVARIVPTFRRNRTVHILGTSPYWGNTHYPWRRRELSIETCVTAHAYVA